MKKGRNLILCLLFSFLCFPVMKVYAADLETSYDEQQQQFVYTLPNGAFFYTTVPIGSRSSGTITITAGENISIFQVLKDGKTIALSRGGVLEEEGHYSVYIASNLFGLDEGESYGFFIAFEIADEKTADTSFIAAPYGFTVDQVFYENMPIEHPYADYVLLQGDGLYEIIFRGAGISYTTRVELDTTAPIIWFSEDITKEYVKKELDFQILEEDVDIQMYRNGKQVISSKNKIVQSGQYEFVIKDKLGNERTYSFEMNIKRTFDIRYLVLLLGIGMCLFTVTFCLRKWRGNVKVR